MVAAGTQGGIKKKKKDVFQMLITHQSLFQTVSPGTRELIACSAPMLF